MAARQRQGPKLAQSRKMPGILMQQFEIGGLRFLITGSGRKFASAFQQPGDLDRHAPTIPRGAPCGSALTAPYGRLRIRSGMHASDNGVHIIKLGDAHETTSVDPAVRSAVACPCRRYTRQELL